MQFSVAIVVLCLVFYSGLSEGQQHVLSTAAPQALSKRVVFRVAAFPRPGALVGMMARDLVILEPLEPRSHVHQMELVIQTPNEFEFRYVFKHANGTIEFEPCFQEMCYRRLSSYNNDQDGHIDIFGQLNVHDGFILEPAYPRPVPLKSSPYFQYSGLNVVSFELDPDDEQAMNKTAAEDFKKPYYPIQNFELITTTGYFQHQTGKARYAGHLGLFFSKKSFVVKFENPVAGIRKFKLKAMAPDSTLAREIIMARLIEAIGTSTYRVGWTMLYINGIYRGLYASIELFDTVEFLESRFPSDRRPDFVFACFSYDTCEVRKQLNTTANHYKPLIPLYEISYEISGQEFEEFKWTESIQTKMDWQQTARIMAINRLASNGDDYLFGNNWFLLGSSGNVPLVFLSHDLEFGMSADNPNGLFPTSIGAPLMFMLAHPNTRSLYQMYLKDGFHLICNQVVKQLQSAKELIRAPYLLDPFPKPGEWTANETFDAHFLQLEQWIFNRCTSLRIKYSFLRT